jgi:ABC-type antimicrobial peptide transport system permease subunit
MVVYRANALDPLVLLSVVTTMALVGIVSASLPARRALTVNPSKLLRED